MSAEPPPPPQVSEGAHKFRSCGFALLTLVAAIAVLYVAALLYGYFHTGSGSGIWMLP